MPVGQGTGEDADVPETLHGAAPRPAGGSPLLLDETTGGTTAETTHRDDRSMAMLEYALAIVAVLAAFLLALIR